MPPGVVTVIGPLVAPLGTVAVTCVSETTVNVAAVPLNVTAVAPVRPEPPIVTLVPACPLVGVPSQRLDRHGIGRQNLENVGHRRFLE